MPNFDEKSWDEKSTPCNLLFVGVNGPRTETNHSLAIQGLTIRPYPGCENAAEAEEESNSRNMIHKT